MIQLPWWEPNRLAKTLADCFGSNGLVWLDGDSTKLGRRALMAVAPKRQLVCRGLPGDQGSSDPFRALAQIQADRSGIWLGWLGYEAGAWVEAGCHWQRPDMATLWAGCYEAVLKLDLQKQELWLEGKTEALAPLKQLLSNGPSQINRIADENKIEFNLNEWHWHTSKHNFESLIGKIQNLIGSGDIFQANLTACAELNLIYQPDPLQLYQKLRSKCPAPFSGIMIANQDEAVLSASPERFLSCDSNGNVETRPIKGTRPRYPEAKADAAAAAELITSSKDRAENVMIVDLLRNDLGRVCEPGSIKVPQLLGLESYAQVHHLTSVVTGKLAKDQNIVSLLKASWPGGSITGAPKISACLHLNKLEPLPRGPYCGSFFLFDFDRSFDSNILIRTVMLKKNRLRVHGGCGIVADSNPKQEAEELGWKVQPLLTALC
jgi:para-aminobenzoate synthetase component 1